MSGTPESGALWAAGVAPGVTPVFSPPWCRTEPGAGGGRFSPGALPRETENLENWKPDAPDGLAPCRVPGFQNFRFLHCSNSLRCRQYARSLNGKFHGHQSPGQFTQVLCQEGPVCTRNLPFPGKQSMSCLQQLRSFVTILLSGAPTARPVEQPKAAERT